jgi:polyhydroxyalkanoate synthase subunit PhaC
VANEGDNQLARGEMELGGQHPLQDVKSDVYVVGAMNDHIVPWQASYKATRMLLGNVRYVLSNGGHVAGIVNPPGPKARHEVAGKNRPTAAEWRVSGEPQRFLVGGSGPDAGKLAGALTAPPPFGRRRHQVLGEAPGGYIHGRGMHWRDHAARA